MFFSCSVYHSSVKLVWLYVRWLKSLLSTEWETKVSTGFVDDCSVKNLIVDEVYLALHKANRNTDRHYVAEVFKVLRHFSSSS